MKTSKKITIFLIILAIVIASVIVARHFVGKHFQKKFSKYPPPGVIVEVVQSSNFFDSIETFGTALSKKNKNFRVKKSEILDDKILIGKIFNEETLEIFSNISDCCSLARDCNWDVTKVRYYHHGEYYKPHIDKAMPFLAFSYFHKQPKRFTGGELVFPKYDYSFDCDNNSLIIFPGWVEHGVNEVSIQNSDYYDGYGRYAITSFFGFKLKE